MYEPRSLLASTVFANALVSTFLRYVFQCCRRWQVAVVDVMAPRPVRDQSLLTLAIQLSSARLMNARISATSSRVTRPRFALTVEAEAALGRLAATRASRSADRLRPHR